MKGDGIPKVRKEVFRKVVLRLLETGVEKIDAKAFYSRCKKVAQEDNVEFPWLQFCSMLYSSECFFVDDGTTVTLPRTLLDWNKSFMEK